MRSLGLRLVVIAGVIFAPVRARAADPSDVAAAEALFREARAAARAGQREIACPKFREAYRLDPTIGTLLNIADCSEYEGHLADAKHGFEEALRLLPPADTRVTYVRSRVRALDERLAKEVAPEVAPTPPPPVEPPKPAPTKPRSMTLPFILGGIGAGALVFSGIAAGLMFDAKSTADDHCEGDVCDDTGLDATRTGKRWGYVGGAAFGAGAVAVGVGAFLFFSARAKTEHAATLTPFIANGGGGLAVGGRL